MREKGDKLEQKISNLLGINKTTNSGAKFDNADLANRKIMIEAKVKDKPSLSIPKGELSKIIAQAKKHSKEWLYIQENQQGTFVIVDIDTFIEMSEEWFIKNGSKNSN